MKRLVGLMFAIALLTWTSSGQATLWVLSDLNSSLTIDDATTSEPAGVNSWIVDGNSHLYEQWFWYRAGSLGGESMLSSLALSSASLGFGGRGLNLVYSGAGFTVDVTYLLTGGAAGSYTSDLAESIRINNTGTSALDFHFFQYSDFDLDNSPGGDTVQFPNANTVTQSGGVLTLSETVVTPSPDHHEADFYPILRGSLTDGSPTTLDDLPAIGGGSLTGDVSWGFQWDFAIAAGGSALISKDKLLSPVPEPGSLILLGGGLLGAATAKLRRRFRA